MWWVVGGCAVLVVLAIAGAMIGGVALLNSFMHGALTCMPSDFPAYPDATVAHEHTYSGTNVPPGATRECQMTLESNDNASTVTDFYASRLSSGDWTIVSRGGAGCSTCPNDKTTTEIKFQRKSKAASVGVIDLVGSGQHTEIRIRFDS
jgi:hypothetical protein